MPTAPAIPQKVVPPENQPTLGNVGGAQNYIALAGDAVHKTCEALLARGAVTEEQAELIRWAFAWAKTNNLSLAGAGDAFGLSPTTVQRVFTGQYGADYAGPLAKIANARRLVEARSTRKDVGFIETSVWRRIDAACTSALNDQMPVFIYGPSQIGKTTCLLEFARRHNHGTSKYVRMPAACTFAFFVQSVARACFIPTSRQTRINDMRERIAHAIDSKNLLIVDEFHQALVTVGPLAATQIMEFIREIYDRTGCGIVLSATNVGETELERGERAGIYDQLRRRGMVKLVLPPKAGAADLRKIAASFDLPPPEGKYLEAVQSMLALSGTGMYIKYLQAAHSLASRRGKPLSWEHFGAVWDGMRKLASGAPEA